MQIANFNSPVAENVVRIMNEKGLKQIFVAQKAGYAKQEFNDMLNGRKIIKICDIPNIAKVLGVEPNDLYAKGTEIDSEPAAV